MKLRCHSCRWEGDHAEVTHVDLEGKDNVLACPACETDQVRLMTPVVIRTWSTHESTPKVPQYRNWVSFRKAREVLPHVVWAFTDGSSTGSCAAAILVRGELVTEEARHAPKPPTWNVGAELGGVLLAVRHAPAPGKLSIVSDYIGSAGYLEGRWSIRDSDTLKRVVVIASLIRRRGLVVSFIHHKGHQKDSSSFTKWNSRVDFLASTKERAKALQESSEK